MLENSWAIWNIWTQLLSSYELCVINCRDMMECASAPLRVTDQWSWGPSTSSPLFSPGLTSRIALPLLCPQDTLSSPVFNLLFKIFSFLIPVWPFLKWRQVNLHLVRPQPFHEARAEHVGQAMLCVDASGAKEQHSWPTVFFCCLAGFLLCRLQFGGTGLLGPVTAGELVAGQGHQECFTEVPN